MNLFFHAPDRESELSKYYRRAFEKAVELFIVTAYLTEWDTSLKLNSGCHRFRVIIGKDFGITRRAACEAVMHWLPPKRKSQFMVADLISGFHPKAVFWKESNGDCFAIIGSSNLTRAAFETNYEANVFSKIENSEYDAARNWVRSIEKLSVPVSDDWLKCYKEALPTRRSAGKKSKQRHHLAIPLVTLKLPKPVSMKKQIIIRRGQLAAFKRKRKGLIKLFQDCASGKIKSTDFYRQLPEYWSYEVGDRLQGAGWERQGKDSDFHTLAASYLRILEATDQERDDIVEQEIDNLREKHVVTRKAFLSEMLCLQFPEEYPVLNRPVQKYLKSVKFKAPRGSSEGARYIDLSRKLRASLLQNPEHPAKNIAELDTVIWLAFGE